MILKELYDYYDILASDEETQISPLGFESCPASYEAVLSEDGNLVGLSPFLKDGKPKSKNFKTPIRMKKSGIAASPVLDNFDYVFGVSGQKGNKEIEEKKFETAKSLHLELFGDAKSAEATAIVAFFTHWDITKAWENEYILNVYSDKGNAFGGNIVFRLEGKVVKGRVRFFHENKEIQEIWLQKNKEKEIEKASDVRQCAITGEIAPIAKLHPQFQGVKGALTKGASLVCFNKDADASYNLEQSLNSAVSQEAAFKYGTALKYLLDGTRQKIYLGDDTTVFWASSPNRLLTDAFYMMMNPQDDNEKDKNEPTNVIDRETEERIKSVLGDGKKGVYQSFPLGMEDAQFYILGLAPNAGRISVRYFFKDTFGHFCRKIKQHYDDVAIAGNRPYIKAGSLIYATVSSKSKNKEVNPLLGGAVARAIFTGSTYPQILFNQIMIRCKTEAFVTQARAAAIKGYLIRKSRTIKKEESIQMSLNESSNNTAYVLGRCFAILEKIQKDALGDLNSGIKDRYFASACSTPALVFPTLLKLAQHHLAKLDHSYLNIQLGKCLSLIEGDSFPKTLDMDNQGRFILGYYQQNQKLYTKKSETTQKEEQQ